MAVRAIPRKRRAVKRIIRRETLPDFLMSLPTAATPRNDEMQQSGANILAKWRFKNPWEANEREMLLLLKWIIRTAVEATTFWGGGINKINDEVGRWGDGRGIGWEKDGRRVKKIGKK